MLRAILQLMVAAAIAGSVVFALRPSQATVPPVTRRAVFTPGISPPPTTAPVLLTTLPAHDFDQAQLESVVAWVQSAGGVPIDLRWDQIDAAESTNIRDRRYTLSLPAGTLKAAMDAILFDDVLEGVLDWRLENGRIMYTSAAADLTRERYDVSAWGGSVPADGNRGRSCIDGWQSDLGLIQAIEAVDPQSWRDGGGAVGTVHVVNGILMLESRSRTHAKVREMLWRMQQ